MNATRLPLMLLLLVTGSTGCGLGRCDQLCQQHADCIEADLAELDTSWQAWTGFADRDAFVEACADPFYDSREAGASRGEVQKRCKAELKRSCEGF